MMEEREAFRIEFGKRVRMARKGAKMKAEELAELAGISPQFLSEVERGKKGVSDFNVGALSRALNVTADYLVLGRQDADATWQMTAEHLASMTPAIRDMSALVLETALRMVKDNVPD